MSIDDSAKILHNAMRGIGTNEGKIIKEICDHNNKQRQEIKQAYVRLFNKTLEEDLKSEISGHFLDGVLLLLKQTDEFEAECAYDAIKGIGTKEKILIEVLCSKNGYELQRLAAAYRKLYGKDLELDVSGDCSGDFGKLLRQLASAKRDDSFRVDQKLANNEANDLFKAGEDRMGTDESKFIRILSERNFLQLEETLKIYVDVSGGTDIETAIKKETSGDFEKGLITICQCVRNRPLYFAKLLHESLAGLGTKDNKLMRILVTCSDIDLVKVKGEYEREFGKSLYDTVKSDLSGDYEKLFLRLIGH